MLHVIALAFVAAQSSAAHEAAQQITSLAMLNGRRIHLSLSPKSMVGNSYWRLARKACGKLREIPRPLYLISATPIGIA
jgi:hypothetical protein